MRVAVDEPFSVSARQAGYYEAHSYEPQKINVRAYHHVFLNRSGICLQKFRLLKDSVPPYPHLWPKFYKIALLSRVRRSTKILPPGHDYLLGHNVFSGGYFHWMTETLPRLLQLGARAGSYQLLVPSDSRILSVIRETTRILGIRTKSYNVEYNYKVEKLSIPTQVRQAEYDPDVLSDLARLLLKAADNAPIVTSNRIYISRKKANRRKIVNEEEIEKALVARGFTCVCLEDYSLTQQVAIMANASIVVSIHGAGLTNIMFMPQGSYVVELLKVPDPSVDVGRLRRSAAPSPSYWRLASVSGLHYIAQFCEAEDKKVPHDRANLVVDLWELRSNLSLINI